MAGLFNARTVFSPGESLITPEELVGSAASFGASSVIVTDTMNICALPELMTAAKKKGVKGIIGTRLRVYDHFFTSKAEKKSLREKARPYFMRCIALSEKGVSKLFEILSLAYEESNFFEVSRLSVDDIVKVFADCSKSDIVLTLGDTYSAAQRKNASEIIEKIQENTGVCLCVDVTAATSPYFVRHNAVSVSLARKYNLGIIASSPVFYGNKEKAEPLNVMKSVVSPFVYDDMSAKDTVTNWTPKPPKEAFEVVIESLKLATQRFDDFSLSKAEIVSTVKKIIADMAEIEQAAVFTWQKSEPSLPKMYDDDFAELKRQCAIGWKNRLGKEIFGYKPEDMSVYKERLVYELKMIKEKNFSSYFLLVARVTSWCQDNGIRVGPGRGSVGGSLIAYLMGITQVDPIRFNLLFERFINPARPDLPDIDLDFMSSRREEVVSFIIEEFGAENVASVSNYLTLAGAGSLSDVSRKMGVQNVPAFGAFFAKEHGVSETLSQAIENNPQIGKFAKENPKEVAIALQIEGAIKSFGKHAAGIIVAGVPIKQKAVVERRSGSNVVCWDKTSCEEFGLVKLDILGLSNLDTIDIAVKLVKERQGIDLDLFSISVDDEKILEQFGLGHTTGVFQFASSTMRGILKSMNKVNPVTFDDLCAATALGRPGPMDAGMVEQYTDRKNGEEEVVFPHWSVEPILSETYGVIVYQEQIMRLVQALAGMTPVDAEGVRKGIGKKDREKIESYGEQFIKGATEGYVKLEMEDGSVHKVHRMKKFECDDGELRTVEEAFAAEVGIKGIV